MYEGNPTALYPHVHIMNGQIPISSNIIESQGNDAIVFHSSGIAPGSSATFLNISVNGKAPSVSTTFLINSNNGNAPNTSNNGIAPNSNGNAPLPPP